MNTDVIVALIGLLGTAIGSFVGILINSRLAGYRIDQLEKKVDKHNNLIERVYAIEQEQAVMNNKIKSVEHRVADLEGVQK